MAAYIYNCTTRTTYIIYNEIKMTEVPENIGPQGTETDNALDIVLQDKTSVKNGDRGDAYGNS